MDEAQSKNTKSDEIKQVAIDFVYNNFSELKRYGIVVVAKDCIIEEVIHHQQIQGPGEAIDVIHNNVEWEVRNPVKDFSKCAIVMVSRYSGDCFSVTDCRLEPL